MLWIRIKCMKQHSSCILYLSYVWYIKYFGKFITFSLIFISLRKLYLLPSLQIKEINKLLNNCRNNNKDSKPSTLHQVFWALLFPCMKLSQILQPADFLSLPLCWVTPTRRLQKYSFPSVGRETSRCNIPQMHSSLTSCFSCELYSLQR